MSNDNILWNDPAKCRPPLRKYYHVKDSAGNQGIAFLNTNRTWTIVDNGQLLGHQVVLWAFMGEEHGWQRLKPYLQEHMAGDYTVKDGYQITYKGRPVGGVNSGQLMVEDVWGGLDTHSLEYIDWSELEVFKRMEVW